MKPFSKKIPPFFFYASVILMSFFLMIGCAGSDSDGDDDKTSAATDTGTTSDTDTETATDTASDTGSTTDTGTTTTSDTGTDTDTAPGPNPNPEPEPTPTPTTTDTNTATDPGLQLSDLVGTYRVTNFSLTGPAGNTMSPDNLPAVVDSWSAQLTIRSNGVAAYNLTINDEPATPINFQILQVRDTQIQVHVEASASMQECTDWAGIRLNGDNLTTTMNNLCGQTASFTGHCTRTSRQVASFFESLEKIEKTLLESESAPELDFGVDE